MIPCEMGTPMSMEILILILLIAGFLLFLGDALLPTPPARPRLTALGLACWILTAILTLV